MNWAVFWLVFAAVGIGAELYALQRKAKGDTLSEQVWALRAWCKEHKADALFAIVVLGVFLWLALHFAFEL